MPGWCPSGLLRISSGVYEPWSYRNVKHTEMLDWAFKSWWPKHLIMGDSSWTGTKTLNGFVIWNNVLSSGKVQPLLMWQVELMTEDAHCINAWKNIAQQRFLSAAEKHSTSPSPSCLQAIPPTSTIPHICSVLDDSDGLDKVSIDRLMPKTGLYIASQVRPCIPAIPAEQNLQVASLSNKHACLAKNDLQPIRIFQNKNCDLQQENVPEWGILEHKLERETHTECGCRNSHFTLDLSAAS